jgi:hypothetical protein
MDARASQERAGIGPCGARYGKPSHAILRNVSAKIAQFRLFPVPEVKSP